MGTPNDISRLAERVTSLVTQGLDVVEAYAVVQASNTKLAREQVKAIERHDKAVKKHYRRVNRLKSRAVTMSAVSGAAAVLGVIDAATDGFAPWALLTGSALSAVIAVRAKQESETISPPQLAHMMPQGTARNLRKDAIGFAEANGVEAVRRQVVTMIPAVFGLHPDAGKELRDADNEAAPQLAAQISRLVLLDHMRRDLPGTAAAAAAEQSARVVQVRLAEGVNIYDRLLAAAASMLASPDLGRSAEDVLGPAADALSSYAEGLRVAANH